METNMKVMETAYNFTDAVIKNKKYIVEKSDYLERTYWININYDKSKTGIAMYDARYDVFIERMPIRYAQQQILKAECVKFDKELQAAELREKELKEEFEAWKKNDGK